MIVSNPANGRGRPHVAGVGISVRAIATDHASGMTAEEIVADRPPLTLPQVYAALAYYHANKDLIDQDITADVRAFEEGARAAVQNPTPRRAVPSPRG